MPSTKIKPQTGPGRRKKYALTDQQSIFVQEYCVDLDGKRAATAAGYSGKNASSKLMDNENVVAAIRQQLGKRAYETELDAKKVLYELALLAFSDPADLFSETGNLLHIQDMPEAIRKSIASCDVVTREKRDGSTVTTAKIKFWSKLEALALIGKHLGILGSQVEQKHLHLHSVATNPYLNAPDDLVLDAKSALSRLENSVQGNIENE